MKKIPVIIDCDPGLDDAIALTLALASGTLDVRAVTVTGGNQTLAKTMRNAKQVLYCLDKHPPLAAGADKPLCRALEIAADVHGASGLGEQALPDPPWQEEPVPAWDLTRSLIMNSAEPVTLILTGPFTNAAILFTAYPEVKPRIERISLMGGSVSAGGNKTCAAEFNVFVDPEAAEIVFNSGIPLTMCGLDVTHQALMLPAEAERLRAQGGKVSRMIAGLVDFYFRYYRAQGFAGAPMHDACAVAALIAPEIFRTRNLRVDVETKGSLTSGMTIADLRPGSTTPPNASVCFDIDRKALIEMLIEACASYG